MDACCVDTKTKHQQTALSIALVGNPNCGKTTLFNALTGRKQRIGNWPGVTVERKSGYFTEAGRTIEAIDLPGIYSLTLATHTGAVDERIAAQFISSNTDALLINVVDASNLERHLYLTLQLLEMRVPLILALNMMDVAHTRGLQIEVKKLSQLLGCPVIALTANKGEGIKALKTAILQYKKNQNAQNIFSYSAPLTHAIAQLTGYFSCPQWMATRLLEDDIFVRACIKEKSCCTEDEISTQVKREQHHIQHTLHEDADILIADARYRFVTEILQKCLQKADVNKITWSTRIDNIVLNRILGIPIFLSVMYLLFLFAINIGGTFQDFFDIASQTLFVDGLASLLNHLHFPLWLTALLANGVGKGINTTLTFIPVIGALFLFLAFLEDSGYMARAAFVVDRFMRALGLPGKAFVPMIVGFGCNVPAIMAARTLENKRDRILTVMMSPFMSCGARLAIFAVFTAAFFPQGGQNIVFALYMIGILMAIFTGFILRHTVLKGEPAPLVMELPAYHLPHFKTLLLHAWQRLKGFVFRAGKLIIPICVLLGALNALNIDGTLNTGDGDTHSILSLIGQWVTPIFKPMGLHQDNWPATVGLVTGILAKEVVVGTLNTLYTQMGHFAQFNGHAFNVWAGLHAALLSIPQNFAQLGNALTNPVLAQAPISAVNQGVYGLMYQKFDGQIGAFAYLLFVLLYFPCVSTTAVMLRELHRGWSIFSIFWMTGVAYATAVIFYQAATWMKHPYASFAWIIGLSFVFVLTFIFIRYVAREKSIGGRYELARS